MVTTTENPMMDAWKRQLDSSMRITEAIIEGSTRMHEVQIEAATEAHADAVATQKALAAATGRFQALDPAGVLAHVSEQYRNGPFTKRSLREHLQAMFALYDAVRARIRMDEVRLIDGAAWIYSTGEISGRLRGLGVWTSTVEWEREPDVARREHGVWRLVGPGP